MKRVFVGLVGLVTLSIAALLPTHSASARSPFPRTLPDGTVVYRFGDAWPILECPVNETCVVEFNGDEVVKGHPINGDPSGAWQIESTRGPYALLSIHPLEVGRFTDITILTINSNEDVGRVYHVFVRSVPASSAIDHIFVRWSYPPTPAPKIVYVPGPIRTPIPTPTPMSPLNDVNFGAMNCNAYRIEGNAPFRPSRVCEDGVRVYVRIPDGASLPAPASNDDGEAIVNWTFDDGWYVIVGASKRYALVRIVNGKRQQVDLVKQ